MQTARQPFSALERNVQAAASRTARKQLMQVPWTRFRAAYEAYPDWQGLSLWSRAVLTSGQHAIPQVLKTLRKCCPEFLATGASTTEPNLLGFRLLEWVHSTVFRYAKREGWLDALTFYGVRHVRSEASWALWEWCENEWSKTPPQSLPTFEQWKRLALKVQAHEGVTYSGALRALERYLDRETTEQWVQPLLASATQMPEHVARKWKVLSRSGRHETTARASESRKERSASSRSVTRAATQSGLRVGTRKGSDEEFLAWVCSHPYHVRLIAYGKVWVSQHPEVRAIHYPSLRRWRALVERYVTQDD